VEVQSIALSVVPSFLLHGLNFAVIVAIRECKGNEKAATLFSLFFKDFFKQINIFRLLVYSFFHVRKTK